MISGQQVHITNLISTKKAHDTYIKHELFRYDLLALREQRAIDEAQEAVHTQDQLPKPRVSSSRCNRCFGPEGGCDHTQTENGYRDVSDA